jgi:hypothetical protein
VARRRCCGCMPPASGTTGLRRSDPAASGDDGLVGMQVSAPPVVAGNVAPH